MINSTTNPKIKNILKLRKTRERREQEVMIVEGYKEIMMATRNGYIINELYYCSDYFNTWWDADKFDWNYSEYLIQYCYEYKSIWGNEYIKRILKNEI